MFAEHGLHIDPEEMGRALAGADVLGIGFTLFPQRLLVDTRASDMEGPLSAVVPPAASLHERFMWLGQHRGAFGMPQNFAFIPWPHTVRYLVERDALAPIRDRLAAQRPAAVAQFDAAINTLQHLEVEAMRSAIRGDAPWHPVWQRAA